MTANGRVLNGYAGDPFMHDPDLGPRLRRIEVPTAVIWGASHRIMGPDYGWALAT
jgi:pimeloyl-ACP methyl ester carboxylesterase